MRRECQSRCNDKEWVSVSRMLHVLWWSWHLPTTHSHYHFLSFTHSPIPSLILSFILSCHWICYFITTSLTLTHSYFHCYSLIFLSSISSFSFIHFLSFPYDYFFLPSLPPFLHFFLPNIPLALSSTLETLETYSTFSLHLFPHIFLLWLLFPLH